VEVLDTPGATVSPKYTEPLRDTPQSISVVPKEVMNEQGVTTLRDTLRNVPGISIAAGEGGAQGDNLTVRGFSARNDLFIDGMRDFGSYYRDPFNTEAVEVLQGPSSVTFGRGTTGGVVNQESKKPKLDSFYGGTFNVGTDQTERVTLDFDHAVPLLVKGAAFRLNLMANDNKVAGRDVAENRRYGIAPALSLGLNGPTQFTVSYLHQTADDTPDYGIPWLLDHPAPVDRQNYYGFPDTNRLQTKANIGTATLRHEFTKNITLHSQTRYAHYSRGALISEALVPTTVTPTTPLASIEVTRNEIAADSVETFGQNQTDVVYKIRTGHIAQTLVAGTEIGHETSTPIRFAFTRVPQTSLLHPDTHQPFGGVRTLRSETDATALSFATYMVDTVKLTDKVQVIGGIRWDRFDAEVSQAVAPASSFNRVDNMVSWRGAIVFRPVNNASIYFDYGTSANPSAEALALSATTANTAPETNKTYEVGSKVDFSRGISTRVSVFRTDKDNGREPSTDPALALQNVLAGSQRVDGFEFELNGRVSDRCQLMLGYALLDSRVLKSLAFPLAVGAPLANVPRNTLTFWTNYRMPLRLMLGGGGQFVDSRTASSTTPFVNGLLKQVPSYWVFDAVAKYPLTDRIDLQVNVYNLANRYYYDQIHPAHIVPGGGRRALAGLNFKF
jgi:catecholate siderophore receptor